MRHGPAEDLASGGDAARALTAEGRKETRQAVAGLAEFVEAPDFILASPLLRAQQTAELLHQRFPAARRATEAVLAPGGTLEELRATVAATEFERVTLVGHEPLLSSFVAWQITGATTSRIAMGKAGVAVLVSSWYLAPGRAELRGLYRRRDLRRAARA
jgi:phosphohistidine phosphatase